MSQTFGERVTAIEERLDSLTELIQGILLTLGLIDENGEWSGPTPDD